MNCCPYRLYSELFVNGVTDCAGFHSEDSPDTEFSFPENEFHPEFPPAFSEASASFCFNLLSVKSDIMESHDKAQPLQILVIILPGAHHLFYRVASAPAFIFFQNFFGNLILSAYLVNGHFSHLPLLFLSYCNCRFPVSLIPVSYADKCFFGIS